MPDIIAAVSTSRQMGAIGILRLSGEGCAQAADQVFSTCSGTCIGDLPNRKLCLGTLRDKQGRMIDQAMVVYSRAPNTYTGEDTVEFHCHGSPAVLAAGLEALFAAGCRQAGPGEFTKRAFYNGRMDLTQAEAVIDLIESETADAAANAAMQVGGALRARIDAVYDRMVDICSHFQAVVDYPDEEIPEFRLQSFLTSLEEIIAQLSEMLRSFERGKLLKNGVRAAILGRPNVGKSSLLNALAGYERAIVTDIAGTTRDTVEETVRFGGTLLRLIDTAGIRDTEDTIEAMGVERSELAAKDADLVLFVCDGSQPLNAEDERAIRDAMTAKHKIGLINKSDLAQCFSAKDLPFEHIIEISAKDGSGLDVLEAQIASMYQDGLCCDGSILTNVRQADAVSRALEAASAARDALQSGLTPDAVLMDVESCMACLGEMTGKTVREDITNRIFERFCVGK